MKKKNIWMICDIDNLLWKSDFVTSWIHKVLWFYLNILIVGQRSCFLGLIQLVTWKLNIHYLQALPSFLWGQNKHFWNVEGQSCPDFCAFWTSYGIFCTYLLLHMLCRYYGRWRGGRRWTKLFSWKNWLRKNQACLYS